MRWRTVPGIVSVLLALQASTADAQSAGTGDRIVFDAGGFGGVAGGIAASGFSAAFAEGLRIGGLRNVTTTPGSSFKWVVGGSVGVGIGPQLLATFDTLVNRIGKPSFRGTVAGQTVNVSASITFSEFTGGVQYLILRGNVSPYVTTGFGLVRLGVSADSSNFSGAAVSATENDLTVYYGGGVRLHLGPAWGLRPDLRLVRIPGETFFRTTVGVFVQVR